MQLRPYQQAAIDAVYDYLRQHDDNPCIVIPTAGGKSPVMATICKDAVSQWGGRVLILAHVKELLAQTADKVRAICPEVPFGIYSAGLKRRDTDEPVILAGIQSVYRRACELDAFDLVIVDECHLIPQDGEGMYREFLADARVVNPNLRVIGLTATPFRLRSGMICAPENILNAICYEVGVRELIRDGYLCPLITKSSHAKADTTALHVREGEYVAGEVEELMDQAGLVSAACAEIVAATFNRQSCLIFASGVRHGKHVAKVLQEMVGKEVGFVSGETPGSERDLLLKRFRGERSGLFDEEPLKYLVNVNVLTTGFDAPGIDCVALLRPTMSPGLFYQMVGRGFRLSPGKRDCLVLDFGNNAVRHGPVDQLCVTESAPKNGGEAPARECPECHRVVAAGYSACPECGYTFPPSDRQKHDAKPSDAAILSGQILEQVFPVVDVYYGVHTKRGADEDTPRTMRVDYMLSLTRRQSEWVCFEHEGFARQRAEAWWRARSHDPVPATAAEAVALANAGALASTRSITVRSVAGEKFDRVVDYVLDEKPPMGEHHPVADLDEIPF